MSIYVDKMPENCVNCAARHGAECWIADSSWIPNFRKERPKWCPLVPVPPHGRLIDADALFEEVYKVWGTEYDASECNSLMGFINEAPTIIPAEEAEE